MEKPVIYQKDLLYQVSFLMVSKYRMLETDTKIQKSDIDFKGAFLHL